jgi:anti-sigma B factor antagonist
MIVEDQLTIDVRSEQDRVVLVLRGELDLLAAPRLQRELESDAASTAEVLVLDLDGVGFIDSAGLRVILAAQTHASERSQRLALTPGSPQVQRLLSIAGVRPHLQTIASADAALA